LFERSRKKLSLAKWIKVLQARRLLGEELLGERKATAAAAAEKIHKNVCSFSVVAAAICHFLSLQHILN